MHSSTSAGGTDFIFNSDLSGDVIISRNGVEFSVPGEDLLEFVAYNYLLSKRIAELEDMDWEQLLEEKP